MSVLNDQAAHSGLVSEDRSEESTASIEDPYVHVQTLEKLRAAYDRVLYAVDIQSANVEKYPNSQYAEATANTLTAQVRALRLLGDEIRAVTS